MCTESYTTPTPEKKEKKVSITKAELAELPAETYGGKITVVETDEDVKAAVAKLASESVIGFDTETKPSFKKGERHSVALLQLSNHTECFLFRLNKIGLPKEVCSLLESENPLKIGVSIHDDFLTLKKRFKIEPAGFIDLQTYVKDFKIADNSLSRIYGILFDKRISKGQRLSNWEASTLTPFQQEYAALDAVACVTIYDHLTSQGFDYESSKYYREIDEPQNQQQEKNT